jgi:Tol biopolymer transport system component
VLVVLAAACGGGDDTAGCVVLAVSRDVDQGTPKVLIVRDDNPEEIGQDVIDRYGSRAPLSQPDFSPDGTRLAVVMADGDYESAGPDATKLWTIGVDGSDARPLTEGDRYDNDPDWSPDGDEIVFVEDLPEGRRLVVIPAEGGEIRPLLADDRAGSTRDDVRVEPDAPTWSPDGEQLAFVRWELPDDADEPNISTVMLVGADGTGLRQVAEVETAVSLSWSPDGDTLLVSSAAAEDGFLALVDVDDGSVERIVDHAAIGVWAPDGRHVYYAAKTDDAEDTSWMLTRSEPDGDKPERIADLPIGYLYFTADISATEC